MSGVSSESARPGSSSVPIPTPTATPTPTSDGRRSKLALLLVLAAYACLALAYNLATPMGEGPDETEHFAFTQYLLTEGRLPLAPARQDEGMIQAKHPPLYYGLGALIGMGGRVEDLGFRPNPFFSFAWDSGEPHNAMLHFSREAFPYQDAPEQRDARVLRLLSLAFGMITVWASWALARLAWPGRPALALLASSLVAFLPGFVFSSAVFTNDAAANACAALALLAALRLSAPGAGRREAMQAGLALGLCLLAKLTTLPLLGLVGLAWLWQLWRRRSAGRSAVRGDAVRLGAWIALPAALLSGWWFLRNMRLYGWSDPLGWQRFSARATDLERQIPLSQELGSYWRIQLDSFWGWFGWLAVRLEAWQYLVARGLALLMLVGLALWFARSWRAAAEPARRATILSLLCAGAVYLSVFRLAFEMNTIVAHGRLLYTALPALGLLGATGLLALTPARAEWRAAVLGSLLMAALASQALIGSLRPAYRMPEPVEAAGGDLPASGRPFADFGDEVRLVGHAMAARLVPGGSTTLMVDLREAAADRPIALSGHLYLQSLPGLQRRLESDADGLVVFLHLVDASGAVVGRWEQPPFEGRHPFMAWQPGEVYHLSPQMELAPDAAGGMARIELGLYPEGEPEARLPVEIEGEAIADSSPGSMTLSRLVLLDHGLVAPDDVATPSAAPLARFGAESALELLSARLLDGDRLELVWLRREGRPLEPGLAGASVFVHRLDRDGALLSTADGPPMGGRLPIEHWPADLALRDVHALEPDDGGSGAASLRIEVGLYELATGDRFPAFDAAGAALPDRRLELDLERPRAD